MEKARAVYDSLPEKDPLIEAVFTHYSLLDGLQTFTFEEAYSVNPVNAVRKRTVFSAGDLDAQTPSDKALAELVDAGGTSGGSGGDDGSGSDEGGRVARFLPPPPALASYVTTDGEIGPRTG